jgi:ribosome biogenesis GTPase
MQGDLKEGIVVRVTGGEIRVDVDSGTIPCLLRGRFRRRGSGFSVVAGDRVSVLPPGPDSEAGTIEAVGERSSWLSRYNEREGGERLIVANVDRLFVVAALRTPPLHIEFIDRVLVAAQRGGVEATLLINKVDLAEGEGERQLRDLEAVYARVGYPVMRASATTGEGVDALAATVEGGIYAFVGESGVGKSSLLMRIDPGLDLKVNTVGEKTGRGRHTTTFSQLYPFGRGYLADTPGVQTFGFPGDDPAELCACFPEFSAHDDCRFQPCSHSHEPGCGVKEAVESGDIPRSRYDSYLNLLAEVEERVKRKSR